MFVKGMGRCSGVGCRRVGVTLVIRDAGRFARLSSLVRDGYLVTGEVYDWPSKLESVYYHLCPLYILQMNIMLINGKGAAS